MMQKAVLMFALTFPVLALVHSILPQSVSAQGAIRCAPNTYCFDDELVATDLVSRHTERLVVRGRMARGSLIEVRHHFLPELVKSVENR